MSEGLPCSSPPSCLSSTPSLAVRSTPRSPSTTRHARAHAALTMGVMLPVRAIATGGGGYAGRRGHVGRGEVMLVGSEEDDTLVPYT